MKTLRTRSFMLLILLIMTLSVVPASAQRTTSTRRVKREPLPEYVQKSWDQQQAIETVEKVLSASGLKYTTPGAGVWIIRQRGENLKFFQLVLYTEGGSLFTEVIVARGKSLRVDGAKAAIPRLAKELDPVKVGFDKDDDLFVRNEVPLKSLNIEELKINLDKVAKAADKAYLEVQQFRSFIMD
ncbi:MAG TPA: YbjN domain-containing protein [Pyrinomonadaceae bacterium]|nr:YbjN domain-containing protein [Pyrinomonadaceae bacterium]